METKKTLKISLEKARKLYKNGNEDMKSLLLETFTKEELEQQELPKTWEEYCSTRYYEGYYINTASEIHKIGTKYIYNLSPISNKITFENKENAEAILALCQLIRLRDEYNGHKPIEYRKENCTPFAIVYNEEKHFFDIIYSSMKIEFKNLFVFHTEELAKEFLKNFKPLLDTFYKIMY